MFESIEYFFQLTGRVLLVHRDLISCIDNGRKEVNSKREKMITDRMLTKISKGLMT